MRDCNRPAPAGLLRGIEQFNRGEFYECHETLEALWLQEPGEVRRLYQGVLQVGVAFHHLRRGNYRGAMALLQRGLHRLAPFASGCQGVDVSRLMQDAELCRFELLRLGPARGHEFDLSLIPQVTLLEHGR